ncbi:RNA-binding region RNP-1 domain-containing protein [Heterostelium album PN500]|uniref:RNA-binding region RNP-1 domain-containing protein n=1 Tax=Heterostelium pallidum (strain ATCC 26659 / Pp 5 / PN500) TaxID=670386 RepID=D3BPE9_HETP5|nr:RNA-binding region RNP-1 domain-containing protein [Heterostelium album PN500]EFA76667.1 RNA-binding region RNP-1 domain-containing protein [Heterostelium album PN500]|eukprot:XP_020428799.1 RNA-binding region RNP-1 domain-containing protein [Heterostelium album PN500]
MSNKRKKEVEVPKKKEIINKKVEEEDEDIEEEQLDDSVENEDEVVEELQEEAEEEGDAEEEEDDSQGTGLKRKKKTTYIIKPMSKERVQQLEQENQEKGIIYLSTIPEKMTPSKLKNLLLKYGTVTRMKLIKANVDRKAYRNDMYKEGWIEFSEKKIARKIALLLHNQPMGGKNRDIHKDCLWNIIYLPKFKWHHLMDKLVQKRLERDKKIQLELNRVRKENVQFMEQVEKSKIIAGVNTKKNKENNKVIRTFKQRSVHEEKPDFEPKENSKKKLKN